MQQDSIQSKHPRASARLARKMRAGLQPRRPWNWRKRGQAIVIFALTLTFLMGLAGLAIDVVRAYDLYAREHRAAEAGALAGDLYMPCFYNSTTSGSGCGPGTSPGNPPGTSTAITAALAEVQLNGFGQGVTPPSSCTGADTSQPVTVCVNSAGSTALQVTVTQPINVFFLSVIGISTFNVSATAAANYLPSTILGSGGGGGGNVWGSGGVSNPKTFLDVINGPAEFQEQGDPFVYCEDGSTAGPPPDGDFSTAITPLSDIVTGTVAGFNTNHLPFATPKCGTSKDNTDIQDADLTGTLTSNGSDVYSFLMSAGAGSGADVYIWNPNYDPSDQQSNSCNGATTPDTFFLSQDCSNYYTKYGPITFDGTHFDDPRLYFDMTYTVYSQTPTFGSSGSVFINPQTFPPLDLYKADINAHCSSGNAYQLPDSTQPENSTYTVGVPTKGPCGTLGGPGFMAGAWVKLGSIGAGQYRLTAEATTHYPKDLCGAFTCGWGRHTFTVAICASGTTPSGSTCTSPGSGAFVSPINDADLYLNFPSGTQNGAIPIAYIPSDYAGRTITFSVFNPGYTRANAPNTYFTIVPPDCSPITIPNDGASWYRTTTAPGVPSAPPCSAKGGTYNWVFSAAKGKGGTTTGDFIYHGLWTDITVTLPSNYATGQWWFAESVGNGSKDFGQICLKVSVNGGSPVHLIL